MPRLPSRRGQLGGDGHRAVLAAGAADGDGQVALPLGPVAGEEEAGQVLGLLEEALGVRLPEDEVADPGLGARERLQLGDEVGVGQEADVEHQVGVGRDAVAEAEGDHRHAQASAPAPTKRLCTSRFSSWTLRRRGVDHLVGHRPQAGERLALGGDPLRDGARVPGQRVAPAGLRVAADERLVGGVEEEDGDVGPLAPQLLDDAGRVGEEARLARVDHQRRCARPRRRCARRARAASPGGRWGGCRRSRSRRPRGRGARWSSPSRRRR